jgi:5-methylthioadenosine/S-adenosylhomocysteine deaminase
MGNSILIKGATVVTLGPDDKVFEADVVIEDGIISSVGPSGDPRLNRQFDRVIDARGQIVLPGFIQTHIHLCQTLMRGSADDLPLIDWLRRRIWPLEAAHKYDSVYASARLGIAELIKGGTTSALTMETVHHTEAAFRAAEESGFRATIGKCMMDTGKDVPNGLREDTASSIIESIKLLERWDGRANGRIRCCFAPRFALSCSSGLLRDVGDLAESRRIIVHTHASESRDEIDAVEAQTGRRNIEYLAETGLLRGRSVLAHCVWIDEGEINILSESGAHVAHCPSSNLKLGSGIAPVPELLRRGISVTLGADGAACNNRLDMFTEMRTAALIQKPIHGPESLPANIVLRMATIDGAKALGIDDQVGSVEVGKLADVQILDLNRLHTTPSRDLVSAIVYAAEASDVKTVIIDGCIVMEDRNLLTLDEQSVIDDARKEFSALMDRASLT